MSEMIPLVPDYLLQGFLDQGINNKAKNQEAEDIMNTGIFMMESSVLRSGNTDIIGIRKLTVDKAARKDCEWKVIKSVANEKEIKKVIRTGKFNSFMNDHASLVLLATMTPFYIGMIMLVAVFVIAGINDAIEEAPWDMVLSLFGALTVVSLVGMPVLIANIKGFRKKMLKKYSMVEPKTEEMLRALTETEILKFWQGRYIRTNKNKIDILHSYMRVFGEPSVEYLPLICKVIGINLSEFQVDLGRMKGGGSIYIKWNAVDGTKISNGLTALSHLIAAADNAAVNMRKEFVENIVFYNNLAAHFNAQILTNAKYWRNF